ncbi:chloramphenicol phosphotransferase CPT family protein [Promicromonospora thailandica]|uniref:Chloramphenicol 3-O phosphotransferase n=1 Tax=Promicromonospora thailandica TaxID=765201 RepID=A0A9X2G053_9MICO|nr:chloramphenicol phosphotransferase CPT family protein [Promicromonospora thailandica]MCP2262782.1 chloramphenicol 3-O phosphotransferase [Promicromonospora thailandica]
MRPLTGVPLCLVVNGPSAAGKSTLTTAIQDRSEVPLLRFGLDELFRMVPEHWGGGLPGARHSGRGFRYENVAGHDGVRRICTGPDGRRMLSAMNAAIVAMLEAGQGVVVDGQAFEPEANRDLETRLRGLGASGAAVVVVVELRADVVDLVDRQRRHRHPAGLAEFHARQPPQSAAPDVVVDTTGQDAGRVADIVWERLTAVYPQLADDSAGPDGVPRAGT